MVQGTPEFYKTEIKKIMDSGDMTDYYDQWDVYQLLLNAKQEVGFEDRAFRDWCMKVSKYAHEMADYMRPDDMSGKENELYWDYLLFEAPYIFESYLLYLEKNREESEKFYEPKKAQLNKHGLIQAMQDLEDDKLRILSISMPPGTQKCQPLYSKILTPNGFIKMQDVKVGTMVISASGNISKVLSVSETKVRPIYEIVFDDGSKTRCSDNHIWKVQTRNDRTRRNKDGSEKYRNIELKYMLNNIKVEGGKRCNYSIDYIGKINFEEKRYVIHPYVMGVLLGDRGLSSGTPLVSTIDKEILNNLNMFLPDGYCMKYKFGCTYMINGHEGINCKSGSVISKELKRYGLFGKTSIHKFIPREYLLGSYEQRLWLLRGLMDTDGSAAKSYCSYATISKQLAKDVVELVHSLGGYASINKRKAGYKKNGQYISCNDYFELIIEFPSEMKSIFTIERKVKKYRPKRKVIKRFITDIKYVGDEECKCIYIDDPSHLYITDDYIITHNTTLEKFFCTWIIGKYPKDYSLFFSHSSDITEMFYKGILDITTNHMEYTWAEIFPYVKLQSTNAKAETINFDKYKPFANIQCTSVGSKNAGKVRCNRYLYCDDLIGGIEEAINKNQLDKLWRIYGTDARQRKLNEQVKEIHIATRWSVHDVIGRLQQIYSSDEKVRFISIPDIDPITGESNFLYKYNGMSVSFFHDQELAMDEISYKCLYKNEPIEREGLLYHDEDLRRYASLPLREPDAILGVCDVKNKGTDFMFMPCAYQYDDDFYIVDCICDDNSDYSVQYERLSNLIVERKMQQCEFESNNGGDRVSFEVNRRVEQKGGRCNITDKPTETNKETRIIVNAAWVKKHCLFKNKEDYNPKEDYGKMMGWLLSYSVVGKNLHDDIPDGFANFALYVTKNLYVKPTRIINSPV